MATATQARPIKKGRFVVLASAITFRTGKRRRDVQMGVRGRVYELSNEHTDVRALLDSGAIAQVRKGAGVQSFQPLTPQRAAMLQNAIDPVAPPLEDVLPMTPDPVISAPTAVPVVPVAPAAPDNSEWEGPGDDEGDDEGDEDEESDGYEDEDDDED